MTLNCLYKSQLFIWWSVVAKVAIIIQMLTISLLGLFADNSLIAAMSHDVFGVTYIFLFQFVLALFLILDMFKTDHSSYQRRSWRLEYYTPISYMLAGGSFLSAALISTAPGWSVILIVNYLVNTLVCGAIAFLLQIKRVKQAIGLLDHCKNDL